MKIASGGSRRGLGDGSKSKKKQCNWWCAACGGRYTQGTLVIQGSADPGDAKVFRAPATGCARESRVCSQVFGERADGWRQPRGHDLRRFAGAEQVENHDSTEEVDRRGDTHEAVKIGDLETNSEEIKGGQAQVHQRDFPERDHPRMGRRVDAWRR